MAERLRALFLNRSIISPSGVGSSPALAHVRQAKICLRMCQVFFLGVLPFSRHLPIGPSHMSSNNIERDVNLNKKKIIIKKSNKVTSFKIFRR